MRRIVKPFSQFGSKKDAGPARERRKDRDAERDPEPLSHLITFVELAAGSNWQCGAGCEAAP